MRSNNKIVAPNEFILIEYKNEINAVLINTNCFLFELQISVF